MNKNSIFIFFIIFFLSCKQKERKIEFEQFQINNAIIPDSITRKLTKFKVNNDVISEQTMNIGLSNYPSRNQNYICEALIETNDTLNIWINNYNGYFGNGILISVFHKNFKIKSVNPHVIKGMKFEKFDPINQELTLNNSNYKKGDSIFGKIYFNCVVDSMKHKKMYGYFKAKIQ